MTNQRAVSDSFRIGRDDIYTCLYLFFNQSGRMPVVHANRCINMYYNRLYHPSRNINHLFRKSVKRYSARFTLFLSARERAMDIIGYNYLKTMQNLHSENCLLAQHLSAKNLLANSADENFIRFWSLFPLNYITLHLSIFLLRREAVCFTTFFFLLSLSISRNHPSKMSLCSIFTGCKPFAISFGGFRQPIHLFMREIAK